jgi:hypothetical protein
MAHYENRYFSKCIFCLKDKEEVGNLTKEHFFGKTIAKTIPTKGNLKLVDGKKGGSPISNITLKALCRNCNNVILAEKIMAPVSNTIIELFSGKLEHIPKDKLGLVKNYFIRLGILVDIATSNYNVELDALEKLQFNTNSHLVKFPPIVSDTERKSFLENFENPRISVQLATYKGNNGELGQATIRVSKFQVGHSPNMKEFLMVYHSLAFIIIIGDNKKLGTYDGFRNVPNFFYKNELQLPQVNAQQLNSLFNNSIDNGPKRSRMRQSSHINISW